MTHLIPEKRMDKNGVLTTKHVKAAMAPATSRNLPAPGLKPEPKQRAFKPTAKQSTVRPMKFSMDYKKADAELTDRLAEDGNHYGKQVWVAYSFEASDAQFYDVRSVTSLGNAATLLRAGVRTKEDALRTLNEMHLERLVEDNSGFTDLMLRKRVPVEKYIEFQFAHDYRPDTDPQHYVDALEVYHVKGYRKTATEDGHELYEAVLKGRFTAADLKLVGANRLNMTMEPDCILDALAAIKDGTADYDAEQLAAFLESAGVEVNYSSALRLAQVYGMEFVQGMRSVWKALAIAERISDQPMETQREILTYSNGIDKLIPKGDQRFDANDVIELFHGGVPPEVAVEHWGDGEGVTAQQIIAIHKEGIAPSVASGWL